MEKFKQIIPSLPNASEIKALNASLSSKKRAVDSHLAQYKDLKAWIDDKLYLINAELQRTKISMGLSGENKRKLVQHMKIIEGVVT